MELVWSRATTATTAITTTTAATTTPTSTIGQNHFGNDGASQPVHTISAVINNTTNRIVGIPFLFCDMICLIPRYLGHGFTKKCACFRLRGVKGVG